MRLHENDICALLDPKCRDLDGFMASETREQLRYRHNFTVINYAFGGKGTTRNCPNCQNIYSKKIGCNFVRCPNLRCNTWFCWECEQKDVDCTHFIVSNCNFDWDDLLKEFYFITFLLFAGGCTLLYFTPSIFLGLFIFSPLVITFASPVIILECVNRQWQFRKKSTSQQRMCLFWSIYAFAYILLLPFGSIIAALSLIVSTLLSFLYIAILFVKLIPIVSQIICILEILQFVTGCFGYGDWLQLYKTSSDKKRTEKIADRQFREERSERIGSSNFVI